MVTQLSEYTSASSFMGATQMVLVEANVGTSNLLTWKHDEVVHVQLAELSPSTLTLYMVSLALWRGIVTNYKCVNNVLITNRFYPY